MNCLPKSAIIVLGCGFLFFEDLVLFSFCHHCILRKLKRLCGRIRLVQPCTAVRSVGRRPALRGLSAFRAEHSDGFDEFYILSIQICKDVKKKLVKLNYVRFSFKYLIQMIVKFVKTTTARRGLQRRRQRRNALEMA